MTPMQRLANALDCLDEETFLSLPYQARKVIYAAVEIEKSYKDYMVEEKEKVIPFPSLKAVK